jgi:hypothetical protein
MTITGSEHGDFLKWPPFIRKKRQRDDKIHTPHIMPYMPGEVSMWDTEWGSPLIYAGHGRHLRCLKNHPIYAIFVNLHVKCFIAKRDISILTWPFIGKLLRSTLCNSTIFGRKMHFFNISQSLQS